MTTVTVLVAPIFSGFPSALDAAGSELSAVFAVQAPASSAVTVGGVPAVFDFFQNRATVSGLPLQIGPNVMDVKVTLADGRSYTQPWIYSRSNATQFGIEVSPTNGSGGLSAQVTFRDIETAGYASARVKCATNQGQDATGQPDYTVAKIKASGSLTCIYPADARVYRIAIDLLSEPTKDAQGNIIAPGTVLERQARYVSVTDPNTFRAQSTYGSFLAYLALGEVGAATTVGFDAMQRAEYADTFNALSTSQRLELARSLSNILSLEHNASNIRYVIKIPPDNAADVLMIRDGFGIWRVGQL